MTFKIKVITKASTNAVIEQTEGEIKYKVKTTVVAEHGKANEKVLQLLSRHLQIKPGQLKIISGYTSNLKTIAVDE